MSLLNHIKEILAESNVDLPVDAKILLMRSHRAIGHLLDSQTRTASRHDRTERLHDNPNYLKSLHQAIGNSIRQVSPNSPNISTPHPDGKKGGLVNWQRPKHQKALLWMAKHELNAVRAQHGNPYNYGTPREDHKMSDSEFDQHIHRLGQVVGTNPWPDDNMKDTISKVDRRS